MTIQDSTYNIRVGRSSDPLGPYLDKNNKDLYDGGGTLLLESKDYMIVRAKCMLRFLFRLEYV